MVSSAKGALIRTRVAEVRLCGRASMGVRIMRLADDDVVTAVARIIPSEVIAAETEQRKANVEAMNDALADVPEDSDDDEALGSAGVPADELDSGEAVSAADGDADRSEWELLRRAEEQRAEESDGGI